MAAEKRIFKLCMIRNCKMLFATRKAVSFNDNLEKCVLAWGTTEPIIVGRIEIGMSPLRMGDECIYENY